MPIGPESIRRGLALIATVTIAASAFTLASAPTKQEAVLSQLGLPALPYAATSEPLRELGRRLFFDRKLSFNNAMSCAMCHVPEEGFGAYTSRTAVGLEGHLLLRNAPTLLNVAWRPRLFHDGRERSLADQAWMPLLHPQEMGNPSVSHVLDELGADAEYRRLFQTVWGVQEPTMAHVGEALQAFERTLVAAGSRFDRWRYGGQTSALTAVEQSGFVLFTGKARCSSCHLVGSTSALFADDQFHVTGAFLRESSASAGVSPAHVAPIALVESQVAAFGQALAADTGRYEITMDPADRYAFRTASLRNIEVTAPYMHDGSFMTLEEVVDFYNRGGDVVPGKSPLIRPLELSEAERAALVAFLKTLTSPVVTELPPQLREKQKVSP